MNETFKKLRVQSLNASIFELLTSSDPLHGEVYSIQHYVIKFVIDLRQVGVFFLGTPVSSTNKTDCHGITEILLKVAVNTINHKKPQAQVFLNFLRV